MISLRWELLRKSNLLTTVMLSAKERCCRLLADFEDDHVSKCASMSFSYRTLMWKTIEVMALLTATRQEEFLNSTIVFVQDKHIPKSVEEHRLRIL